MKHGKRILTLLLVAVMMLSLLACGKAKEEADGAKIGECKIGADDGVYKCVVDNVVGRHSLYFVVDHAYSGAFENMFDGRNLFELESFVFMK